MLIVSKTSISSAYDSLFLLNSISTREYMPNVINGISGNHPVATVEVPMMIA